MPSIVAGVLSLISAVWSLAQAGAVSAGSNRRAIKRLRRTRIELPPLRVSIPAAQCPAPCRGAVSYKIDSRCAPLIPETSLVVHRPRRTVGLVWAGRETDAKLGEWKTLNRFVQRPGLSNFIPPADF